MDVSLQLHLEIIHQEEAITDREKEYELQIDGLRDDLKKLQFLNAQKTQQCIEKVVSRYICVFGCGMFAD